MAAARRINPKDFFTAEEWAGLARRSTWRGPALVAHCWAVIFAAAALAIVWPVLIPVAVMIIGTRQLGLAILMHDAAHGALHRDLKINDWIAKWLCAAPVGASLEKYRPYHLTHHRYAQQPEDPDLVLSAPFPINRGSLRRKMVRDMTGRTFYKQRVAPIVKHLRKRRGPDQPLSVVFQGGSILSPPFLLTNAVLFGLGVAAGAWWAWFVLWLLPMAIWLPLVTRLRNIAEHACVPDDADPLRHARTTKASWWERAFIAPYWVNYHVEHHMFMHLPCWTLPQAHRILERKGVTGRMEVQPGYLQVLRVAAGKPDALPA